MQGDPTDSVLSHFRFRLVALLSTICSPPTIRLTHNVHHGVGFPEHSITPGWQIVLHLQTKGEVMVRRMERASSQKNRKFIHQSTILFASSLFVCIDTFQNTTRAGNTEIGLGHFLLQELLSQLCHALLKGNQFSPTPVAFCLV